MFTFNCVSLTFQFRYTF